MARKATTKAVEKKVVEPEVVETKEEVREEVKEEIKEEVKEAPKPEKKVKVEKKTFAQNDGIRCRSMFQGRLFMNGDKSGMTYSFNTYGDVVDVEYRDLVSAIQSKSSFIYIPYIIVEDDDFIAEFSQLKKFYEEKYAMMDLRGILNLSTDAMRREIEKLPDGAKLALRSIASTAIQDGELDSISKIKAIDDVLGTQLSLYMK